MVSEKKQKHTCIQPRQYRLQASSPVLQLLLKIFDSMRPGRRNHKPRILARVKINTNQRGIIPRVSKWQHGKQFAVALRAVNMGLVPEFTPFIKKLSCRKSSVEFGAKALRVYPSREVDLNGLGQDMRRLTMRYKLWPRNPDSFNLLEPANRFLPSLLYLPGTLQLCTYPTRHSLQLIGNIGKA